MSIEVNKKDFEDNLTSLKAYLDDADTWLSNDLVAAIEDVIAEYEDHLKNDIEEIVDQNSAFEERVVELETNVQTLESELEEIQEG